MTIVLGVPNQATTTFSVTSSEDSMNCFTCDRAAMMCPCVLPTQQQEPEKKKNISSGEDAWVEEDWKTFTNEYEEQRQHVLA